MADYWKSQARKFCDFCKCWIADNKPSIDFHENGKRHKENVSKRLKEIHKNSAKQAKQQKKFEDDFQKMEAAAMAAYLKDVQNNTRDMTADNIISEKWNKSEETKVEPVNPNSIPQAAPETHPRFKQSYGAADIDPLDPYAQQKLARLAARKAKNEKNAAKNEEKTQEKSQSNKEKGKGKKSQNEVSKSSIPEKKIWYEVRAKGYSYYWNTNTNETTWEPPVEGFMSIEEQEEEAKEQAIQEEFLNDIEKEEEQEKARILEEKRANAERERLKEIRKKFEEDNKKTGETEFEEEKIPYRRDYSVSEKPQPYGSWQVVKTVESQIDLQLPEVKEPILPNITFEEPVTKKVFKEKIITHISTGDSDDEGSTVSFKKRKIGNKNVRKRTDDFA